jgi:hypothetical protein
VAARPGTHLVTAVITIGSRAHLACIAPPEALSNGTTHKGCGNFHNLNQIHSPWWNSVTRIQLPDDGRKVPHAPPIQHTPSVDLCTCTGYVPVAVRPLAVAATSTAT